MIAPTLAAWAVGPLDVPAPVRAAAVRHLADGLGTALAAVREDAAAPAVAVATGLGGAPEATVIGSRVRVSAPAAALANGTLVHALDLDDTHAGGLVHATAVVLPAAFAVGQERGSSGREVLDAAVAGYETACRIAAAAPHGFHARGLHATMVAGVFSSAVVAARLMRLDAATTAAALGIAGSQAGGLLAFLGSEASTKQLHPGFAGQAGLLAARLAAAGATGPATVLDGPHGVYDALAADGSADPAAVLDGLGERWETTRIGIKPYPVCQLSHATLDALADALASRPFTAAEVATLEADVHPDSVGIVCDETRDLAAPPSAYAAKFSLPWCVAARVVDGGLGLAAFRGEWAPRPEVADLARRVTWRATGSGAAADAPGRVVVTLRDGTRIVGEVARSAGGPDQPLTRDQLLAKVAEGAGPAGRSAAELVETLAELETLEPLLAATVLHPDPEGSR